MADAGGFARDILKMLMPLLVGAAVLFLMGFLLGAACFY